MAGEKIRVLYAGDGETINYLVTKGLNFYMGGGWQDESMFLKNALSQDGSIEVDHIKPGESMEIFPRTMANIQAYQVVILSDIGADSILFYMDRDKAPMGPNRLKLIKDYVSAGGGFLMIGGWSSFGGWGGQARYHDTPIEEILPVIIKDGDDRVETPEGCTLQVQVGDHPLTKGLPWNEEIILSGYNRLTPKQDTRVLITTGRDPMLVVGAHENGRTAAFATDCAPHWAGTMINWPGYPDFWIRLVRWLAKTP